MTRKLFILVVLTLAVAGLGAAPTSAAASRGSATITVSGNCQSLTTTVTWSNVPKTAQVAHNIEAYVNGQWRTTAQWDVLAKAASSGTSTINWSQPTVSRVYAVLMDRSGNVLLTTPRTSLGSSCPALPMVTGASSPSAGTVVITGQNLSTVTDVALNFAQAGSDNVIGKYYYLSNGDFTRTDTQITITDPYLSGHTIASIVTWDTFTGSSSSGSNGRLYDGPDFTVQ